MPPVDADEVLDVVTSRADLMRSLASDWRRKGELTDSLSVSRSTVDRGVRELVEAGLAERADGRYRLTVAGQLALSEYEQFTGRVDGALSARTLLESMTGGTDLDPVVFDGATVVARRRDDADDPIAEVDAFLGRTDHLEAVFPALAPEMVALLEKRLLEGDASATVVLGDSALETLTSRHRRALEAVLETGRVTCLLADEAPSYSLVLAERREQLCLVVQDERSVVGVLLNETPEAFEWARGRFDRCADSAHPLANGL
jgi:predicted transcriptional regulator